MSSNRLGELLVRNGLITDDQLVKALGEQQSTGGRLGSSLVKLGFISEDELSAFLSKQYGVPSVNLNEFEVDPVVIATVPADEFYFFDDTVQRRTRYCYVVKAFNAAGESTRSNRRCIRSR